MSGRVARRVLIEGRVQGVWYRGWTVDQARARGLSGWVRNRRDGSVEALFAGPNEVVDEMISLCWTGPRAAQVTAVSARPDDAPADDAFHQLSTE